MAKIVMYLGRSTSGDFYDPISGQKLSCVAEGSIQHLVDAFTQMRSSDGILQLKKGEVELKSIHLMSNHTAGGEMKAPHKFKK